MAYLSPNLLPTSHFNFHQISLKTGISSSFLLDFAPNITLSYFQWSHLTFKPISHQYLTLYFQMKYYQIFKRTSFQDWHPTSHSMSQQTSNSHSQSTYPTKPHLTSNLSRLDPFWLLLTTLDPVDPFVPTWPQLTSTAHNWPQLNTTEHNWPKLTLTDPNWHKLIYPNCTLSYRAYLRKGLRTDKLADRRTHFLSCLSQLKMSVKCWRLSLKCNTSFLSFPAYCTLDHTQLQKNNCC